MPLAISLHYLVHWPTHGGYNCHVHRCWRLEWHPHPVHGHPVCKKHHPDGHRVTAGGELRG